MVFIIDPHLTHEWLFVWKPLCEYQIFDDFIVASKMCVLNPIVWMSRVCSWGVIQFIPDHPSISNQDNTTFMWCASKKKFSPWFLIERPTTCNLQLPQMPCFGFLKVLAMGSGRCQLKSQSFDRGTCGPHNPNLNCRYVAETMHQYILVHKC